MNNPMPTDSFVEVTHIKSRETITIDIITRCIESTDELQRIVYNWRPPEGTDDGAPEYEISNWTLNIDRFIRSGEYFFTDCIKSSLWSHISENNYKDTATDASNI